MATLNKIMLIGRLGQNPDVRATGTGMKVCNFSLATSESFTKNGEKKEVTEWHKIIAWDKTAELCAAYLKKGSSVYVEGKIQTRKYTNKQGVEQYATEIIAQNVQFLTSKKDSEQVSTTESFDPVKTVSDDLEDIPF